LPEKNLIRLLNGQEKRKGNRVELFSPAKLLR